MWLSTSLEREMNDLMNRLRLPVRVGDEVLVCWDRKRKPYDRYTLVKKRRGAWILYLTSGAMCACRSVAAGALPSRIDVVAGRWWRQSRRPHPKSI